jgi:glutathione peroxidase
VRPHLDATFTTKRTLPWWKDLVDYGLTPNEPPEVLWNFEKFLINKNGEVVARFAPDITANDPRIVDAINAELAK